MTTLTPAATDAPARFSVRLLWRTYRLGRQVERALILRRLAQGRPA